MHLARPFCIIGIYLFFFFLVQLTATIIPYFVVNWMQQPQYVFSLVAIAVQGTALIMLFVWSKVSERYGKKAVYFMGMSLWIIAQAGLFFLQPGQVLQMSPLSSHGRCRVSRLTNTLVDDTDVIEPRIANGEARRRFLSLCTAPKHDWRGVCGW